MTILKCSKCNAQLAVFSNLQKGNHFIELALRCKCGTVNNWDDIFTIPEGFN